MGNNNPRVQKNTIWVFIDVQVGLGYIFKVLCRGEQLKKKKIDFKVDFKFYQQNNRNTKIYLILSAENKSLVPTFGKLFFLRVCTRVFTQNKFSSPIGTNQVRAIGGLRFPKYFFSSPNYLMTNYSLGIKHSNLFIKDARNGESFEKKKSQTYRT